MFVIVDVETKEWFTMHGFKPHFTNNSGIRWQTDSRDNADMTHYQLVENYFPKRELEVRNDQD